MRFLIFILLLFCSMPQAFAAEPERVYVGAYMNDIQDIDLHADSYRLDFYVWFRWKDPAIDPSRSAEFMNAFSPSEHVRTYIYDKPQKMPDGSLYSVIRQQGQFSAKFPLHRYPFDHQDLIVAMEDTVRTEKEQVYIPDTKSPAPMALSSRISLPGYDIGKPELQIEAFPYPTNFGDISQPDSSAYARALFSVPVHRPPLGTGIKVFLPVLLVMACASLVFFVHPGYIEGRLGVAITALLTLVALQLTSASTLPEVDYLLMTDKVYLLSYMFIIATMMQVARESRRVHAQNFEEVRASDRRALKLLAVSMAAGLGLVFWVTF